MPHTVIVDINSLIILLDEAGKIKFKITESIIEALTNAKELINKKTISLKILTTRPSSPLVGWGHGVKRLPDGREHVVSLNEIFFNLEIQLGVRLDRQQDVIYYRQSGDDEPSLNNLDTIASPADILLLSSNDKLLRVADQQGCKTIACFKEAALAASDTGPIHMLSPTQYDIVRVFVDIDATLLDRASTILYGQTAFYGPVVAEMLRIKEHFPQAVFMLLTARPYQDQQMGDHPTSVRSINQMMIDKVGIEIQKCYFTAHTEAHQTRKIDTILKIDEEPGLNIFIDDSDEELSHAQRARELDELLAERLFLVRVHREGSLLLEHLGVIDQFVKSASVKTELQEHKLDESAAADSARSKIVSPSLQELPNMSIWFPPNAQKTTLDQKIALDRIGKMLGMSFTGS
jgi:hypothetical protein